MALQINLRPLTADDTFLTAVGNVRWTSRSISSKRSPRCEDRMVRNLMNTSDVSTFLQSTALPKESTIISSVKALNKVELHFELIKIRNRFDKDRKRYSMDDTKYKHLQRQTQERLIEEKKGLKTLDLLKSKQSSLITTLKLIEKQQVESQEDMQTNTQILERCKKNRVFLEKKNIRLKNELKKINFILEDEKKTQYRERQSKSCSQRVYKLLNQAVESDRREKELVIDKMYKDIQIREVLQSKREDRVKRYVEISELAANDAKNKKEIMFRESVLMHKMLAGLYTTKLLEMKKKNSNIEEAFMKMRVFTGELNVIELIQKFLTREHTFKELRVTIEMSRKSIEDLNSRNNQIEFIIKKASVVDKDSRSSEYYKLKEKQALAVKELEASKIRLGYIKGIYEHIDQWVERLAVLLKIEDVNGNLLMKFKNLARVIAKLLTPLKSL